MMQTRRAYLKTEGKTDYRDCQIYYYTYSMFNTPNKFGVGVNLHAQSPQGEHTISLALDEEFTKESSAIDFAIAQGKESVDKYYAENKIQKLIVNPLANKITINNTTKKIAKK